jgi:hypothetical protein
MLANHPGVEAELERHEGEAEAEARRHRRARSLHARLVYGLGIPAGTLAVIAGSTALADVASWITAVVAFGSAAATTATALVDPLAGRVDHGRKEADFADFARMVRLTRLRLEGQPPDEQFAALEELNRRRHELDDRNPIRQVGSGPQNQPWRARAWRLAAGRICVQASDLRMRRSAVSRCASVADLAVRSYGPTERRGLLCLALVGPRRARAMERGGC